MFNKQSVGKRVLNPSLGVGTIIKFSQGLYYPVQVKWDNYANTTIYTAKGWDSLEGANPIKDITLLITKQGTPEARRIVAMLASKYRKLRYVSNYSNLEEYMYNVYQQAKQLLGESK